jgi:hypothetical protein
MGRHRLPVTRRSRARRALAAVLTLSLATGTAWGFWTSGSAPGGNGAAAATTVDAGATPTATVTARAVTLAWDASSLASGASVAGYLVRRLDAATLSPQPLGAGCTGTVVATTCTETAVPDGTWLYTVTPVIGTSWRGATSPASTPVVIDAGGPTGGSVDATGLVGTGSRYSTTPSLSLTLAKGTDAHGLASSGAVLTRSSGTLSNGLCSAFTAYAAVAGGTDPVSPFADTVPATHACYRYQYSVPDTAGNRTTYLSPDIKVDPSAPGAPGLTVNTVTNAFWSSGSVVHYRPGVPGSFQVNAAGDPHSGTATYQFPTTLGTGWTTGGTGASRTYSWTDTPASPGPQPVTVTSNAGVTSPTSTFTPTPDATPPTATVGYADGATTADTVDVTTTATDSQSGIATRSLQRSAAPLTGATCGVFGGFQTILHGTDPLSPWGDPVGPGCYRYRYVVTDRVGHTTTATNDNVVRVDDSPYAAVVKATASLLSFWRLGEKVVTSDTFTGAAGTALASRAGETGATWTRSSFSGAGNDSVLTPAGRLRRKTAVTAMAGALHYAAGLPPSADYTVEADVYVASNLAGDLVGVSGRTDPSGTLPSLYAAGYDQATQRWSVSRVTPAGLATLASSAAQPLTPGVTYRLALDMRGTSIRVLVDGAVVLSVVDSTITAPGLAGVLTGFGTAGSAAPTDSTGMHLDNVRVTPALTDSFGSSTGHYGGGATLGVSSAISGDQHTAAVLDGVDDVATAPAQITGSLSVELWFRSTRGWGDGTSWTDGAGLVDATAFGISLSATGAVVGGVGSPGVSVSTPGGGYDDGTWHHVVLTREQTTGEVALYVDGVLAGRGAGPAGLLPAEPWLTLGRITSTPASFFAGALDEVAVYGAALSADTVSAHLAAALPQP